MPQNFAITPDQLKVFETVPDLYLILSPDLRMLTASDAFLSATHTVRSELVGKYVFDVFPENTSSAEANAVKNLKASLSEVLATGKPHKMALQRFDILGPIKNGEFEERYWQPLNTPVLNSEGNVRYIIHKVSDETQHIKNHQYIRELTIREQAAQHEAERQQQLLHLLYMEAPAPIVILEGKNFVYQLINPAYQKIFPGRELLGKPILEALPELKDTSIPDLLEKVYQTGESYVAHEMPLMMARYEGDPLEEMFWNFTYQARRDQQEKIDGVLVYAYEVTEQVLARKKLEKGQEELKQFKFMADQAQDPFILMREDGSFAYLNKKALETLGYSEAEVNNLRVPDVDPVYQHEQFVQLFKKAQTETIPQFETLHKGKAGNIYPVEVNVVGLTIAGKPYLFAVARDISLRKQAEEALKENNEELISINNDLDNFIYTASHDLKAPISNIEALLNALLRTLPPETLAADRTSRITSMMQESIERFKKTIASLTEVVKLQKENNGEAVMVNLLEVFEEVRLDLEQVIKSSGARIEVEVDECPPIHFSHKNLRSVVYNLISNAIKYRVPERVPRVQLRCTTTPEYHVLSVQDNGLGIEPNRIDQLFTMFKRFHSHIEGTGIGLYMIKKMIDNAGGRIEVDSTPGEGTTFYVYFRR